MPLSKVDRLEILKPSSIETTSTGRVVQYGDDIMPLVSMSSVMGLALEDQSPGDSVAAIVCSMAGRPVGLVVKNIVDIVNDEFNVRELAGAAGVIGSAVIKGSVTDLIDVQEMLRLAGVQSLLENTARVAAVGAMGDQR